MTDYKLTKEDSRLVSIRVHRDMYTQLKAKFYAIRDNGKVDVNTVNIDVNMKFKKVSSQFIKLFNDLFYLDLPDTTKRMFADLIKRHLDLKLVDEVKKLE